MSLSAKKSCTKTQLQSLLGSLLYINKSVRPARFFLNRMLQVLSDNTELYRLSLTNSFHHELNWFLTLLTQYNGVTYFDNKKLDFDVHLDASLTGFGAKFGPMVSALPLGDHFKDLHITRL